MLVRKFHRHSSQKGAPPLAGRTALRAQLRLRGGPGGRVRGVPRRAAESRNRRRPGAAAEGAEVRHRPCGDRRPRTSRRNPTGVRSGRSACRRFPFSYASRVTTRTVLVDRVSRVISSASATLVFQPHSTCRGVDHVHHLRKQFRSIGVPPRRSRAEPRAPVWRLLHRNRLLCEGRGPSGWLVPVRPARCSGRLGGLIEVEAAMSSVHTARTSPCAPRFCTRSVRIRDDQGDARGEHLLAEPGRRDRHAQVVVAGLVAPGPGRIVPGARPGLGAAVGQVRHAGGDLLDEPDGRADRRPHPQTDVGDLLAHRRLHHPREVGGETGRIGDDVGGAEQRRGDPCDFFHFPVGAHAPRVAGEPAGAGVQRGPQILR